MLETDLSPKPTLPAPLRFFKEKLIAKISLQVILLTTAGIFLTSLANFHEIYWQLFPILLVFSLIICLSIWRKVKPLNDLKQAANLYAKGELLHRLNLKTSDEIGQIAQNLNRMAEQLDLTVKTLSESKQETSLEVAKLNTILSNIVDGIIVLDLHRQVMLANKAAQELTGYTLEEMKLKSIDQLITITNQEGLPINPKVYAPVDLGARKVDSFLSNETFFLVDKRKTKTPVSLTGEPITGNMQANLGTVLAIHNLYRERQLESIQLDFVSMASHELRTPLTSIIGYMTVFLEENSQNLNGQQRNFLNRILISARELGTLIENLLSVSKIERGALTTSLQPLVWEDVLKKAVDQNLVVATQKNISLKLELPFQPLAKVNADSVRIIEVINNLLSNAINYTPSGGQITVKAQDIGSEVVTSIADTGIGIPPDALPHLFTKFFRIKSAIDSSSNSKGTGLGLYLSKSIIELHHGRIWANSTLNQGSTFYFTLPIFSQKVTSGTFSFSKTPYLS